MAGGEAVTPVLDASSILAVIFEEPGADIVIGHSDGALLSAVNLDEVLHKSARRDIAGSDVEQQLTKLGIVIVPFASADVRIAAALHPRVDRTGTSFADRACLALGIATGGPIFTCDGKWLNLGLDLDIRLIR
jgi:ribonuclease VapC